MDPDVLRHRQGLVEVPGVRQRVVGVGTSSNNDCQTRRTRGVFLHLTLSYRLKYQVNNY